MTNRIKMLLLDILTGVLILIAAGSGVLMVRKTVDSKNNAAGLESLVQAVAEEDAEKADPGAAGSHKDGGTGIRDEADREAEADALLALRKKRQERYTVLKEENPDMMGWLSIEDTKINYPVTQSTDRPNFYLTHNFQKEKSSFGNPYLAESCDMSATPDNVIIYGHHMKDGSMFAGLMKYADEDYYKKHPVIRFDTLTELGEYEILGVFSPTAEQKDAGLYQKMQASDSAEYEAYVDEVRRRSYYDTGISAVYGDQLLTLITCEYSQKNGRLIVVARKMNTQS